MNLPLTGRSDIYIPPFNKSLLNAKWRRDLHKEKTVNFLINLKENTSATTFKHEFSCKITSLFYNYNGYFEMLNTLTQWTVISSLVWDPWWSFCQAHLTIVWLWTLYVFRITCNIWYVQIMDIICRYLVSIYYLFFFPKYWPKFARDLEGLGFILD